MKVAVLKGGTLAGADGLAALRRARRGRAGAARATTCCRSTSAPTSSTACRPSAPTSRSWRCTAAAARTGPSRSCSSSSASPTRPRGPGACIRCMDKVVAKHALRDAGHPDARLLRLQPDRVRGARRGARAAGDRGAAGVPDRGQARRPGLGAGDQVRPHRGGRPERAGGRVLLRHEGAAGALRRRARPRGVGARRARRPGGAAGGRGDPGRPRTSTTSRRATRSARTRFVCPADLPPELTARAQELALATWRTLGCAGFARVDLMLDGDELTVLEANAIPGLTDTSLLPLAAEAAGHRLRRLRGARARPRGRARDRRPS